MSNSDAQKVVPRNSPVPLDRCGMASAAHLLMEKWNMLIIREAFYGVARFEDILEDLKIPRSVLTTRLKQLVESGILERTPYRQAGTRTRFGYLLTDKGRELGLVILALMQWGDRHLLDGGSAISVSDRRTGQLLKVGLIPDNCDTPDLSDVQISVNPVQT